jgi:hypothetical protein
VADARAPTKCDDESLRRRPAGRVRENVGFETTKLVLVDDPAIKKISELCKTVDRMFRGVRSFPVVFLPAQAADVRECARLDSNL